MTDAERIELFKRYPLPWESGDPCGVRPEFYDRNGHIVMCEDDDGRTGLDEYLHDAVNAIGPRDPRKLVRLLDEMATTGVRAYWQGAMWRAYDAYIQSGTEATAKGNE